MSELLIGCGSNREKRLFIDSPEWKALTTLDLEVSHKPDVVWDLDKLPLPFEADSFDEIHAYEVLEHTGRQGDWKFFFAQFTEFHRILKNGGHILATVPHWRSEWAWGDPSHTRVLTPGCLSFLSQRMYREAVGVTAMSDFRAHYKADFEPVGIEESETQIAFVLRAVK